MKSSFWYSNVSPILTSSIILSISTNISSFLVYLFILFIFFIFLPLSEEIILLYSSVFNSLSISSISKSLIPPFIFKNKIFILFSKIKLGIILLYFFWNSEFLFSKTKNNIFCACSFRLSFHWDREFALKIAKLKKVNLLWLSFLSNLNCLIELNESGVKSNSVACLTYIEKSNLPSG